MEKDIFARYYKDSPLSEADEELLNYDDSKISRFWVKRNLLIKRLLLPFFPGGITVLFFIVIYVDHFIYSYDSIDVHYLFMNFQS